MAAETLKPVTKKDKPSERASSLEADLTQWPNRGIKTPRDALTLKETFTLKRL